MLRQVTVGIICLVLLFWAGAAQATSVNVALLSNGATASAENYGTYLGDAQFPWKAIDADSSTGWSSNGTCPSWLKVEFDQVYTIGTVAWWTGSHTHMFSIGLSTDDANWTTVVPSHISTNLEAGPSTYMSFDIAPTDARYMRMDIRTTSAPGSHIFQSSVNELEAYTAEPVPEPTTVAAVGCGMAGLAGYIRRRRNR